MTFQVDRYRLSVGFGLAVIALCVGGCASSLVHGVKTGEDLSAAISDPILLKQFEVSEVRQHPAPPIKQVPLKKTKKKKKGAEPNAITLTPPSAPNFEFPNRRPVKDPIWRGETLVYEVTWMGIRAGEFRTEVLPLKQIGDRKVYHIKGTAKSHGFFGMVYRLEDYAETFMDYEGWFSHRFHILQQESKQFREVTELYDQIAKKVFYWSRTDHKDRGFKEVKEFREFVPFSEDSLSAMYYMRQLELRDGSSQQFYMVADGHAWEATANVVGRVDLLTGAGKIRSIKIRPDVKFQGILQGSGESYIYLSDDERRYCTRLEAQVKIGKFILDLKEIIPGLDPAHDSERIAAAEDLAGRRSLASGRQK